MDGQSCQGTRQFISGRLPMTLGRIIRGAGPPHNPAAGTGPLQGKENRCNLTD